MQDKELDVSKMAYLSKKTKLSLEQQIEYEIPFDTTDKIYFLSQLLNKYSRNWRLWFYYLIPVLLFMTIWISFFIIVIFPIQINYSMSVFNSNRSLNLLLNIIKYYQIDNIYSGTIL